MKIRKPLNNLNELILQPGTLIDYICDDNEKEIVDDVLYETILAIKNNYILTSNWISSLNLYYKPNEILNKTTYKIFFLETQQCTFTYNYFNYKLKLYDWNIAGFDNNLIGNSVDLHRYFFNQFELSML